MFRTSNNRRYLAAAFVGVVVSTLVTAAARAQSYNEASYYDASAMAGTQLTYAWPQDVPDLTKVSPNLNDKISFISMGDDSRTMVFEHTYYGGRCTTFAGTSVGGYYGTFEMATQNGSLSGRESWDNRISSFVVRDGRNGGNCTTPSSDEAIFWVDTQFGGGQLRLVGPASFDNLSATKGPGGSGSWNDKISSMKLGANVRVLAWENRDFSGRCITIASTATGSRTSNYTDLRNLNAGLDGRENWNDRISSLEVVVNNYQTCP